MIIPRSEVEAMEKRITELEQVERWRDEELAATKEKHGNALIRITALEAANAKIRKCLESIAEHHDGSVKRDLTWNNGQLTKFTANRMKYHTERRDIAREGLK